MNIGSLNEQVLASVRIFKFGSLNEKVHSPPSHFRFLTKNSLVGRRRRSHRCTKYIAKHDEGGFLSLS